REAVAPLAAAGIVVLCAGVVLMALAKGGTKPLSRTGLGLALLTGVLTRLRRLPLRGLRCGRLRRFPTHHVGATCRDGPLRLGGS
ncbi:hypothetical protein, partial [Methylobacterium sp. J-090]|uniref:hypothetical protein n=1 Tax=Methylobacterium sp. J-090 TaxID=2836666 RepID=UPI001FB8990D